MPYRDFVFVHPPGIAYLTAALSWLGPYRALAAGRLLAVLAGVASVLLVGVVARRAWGPVAGLAGAAVYAVFPEAVWVEHGVFIEPWLNVTCLGVVACWQRCHDDQRWRRWAAGAGLLLGVAVGLKLWAVLLVPALLVWPPTGRARDVAVRASAGFAAASLIIWLPVLVAAGPGDVWQDTVAFHLSRPPDGIVDRWARLAPMLLGRHAPLALLALLAAAGLGIAAARFRGLQRAVAVWLACLVIMFVASAAWWDQYNAALAPPVALLAGFGAARLAAHRVTAAHATAGALAALAVAWTARTALREGRLSGGEAAVVADTLRTLPADADVCSFEPGWLLAAGRPVPLGRSSVDPYASWIAGQPQPDCEIGAAGARGERQLGPAAWAVFVAGHEQIGDSGVWVRR